MPLLFSHNSSFSFIIKLKWFRALLTATDQGLTLTMTTAANFTSIPTLNYNLLASPDTRPAFIQQLQNALINIGFLYLEHLPIPAALLDEVVAYLPRFFV